MNIIYTSYVYDIYIKHIILFRENVCVCVPCRYSPPTKLVIHIHTPHNKYLSLHSPEKEKEKQVAS